MVILRFVISAECFNIRSIFTADDSPWIADINDVGILVRQDTHDRTTAWSVPDHVNVLLLKLGFTLSTALHDRLVEIMREMNWLCYESVQVVGEELTAAFAAVTIENSKELNALFCVCKLGPWVFQIENDIRSVFIVGS